MSNLKKFELLSTTGNTFVVRHLERNYPGIMIQGDTMKIIYDDIEELQDDISNKNLESAEETLKILKNKFFELLSFYEKALNENNFDYPYAGTVSNKFE